MTKTLHLSIIGLLLLVLLASPLLAAGLTVNTVPPIPVGMQPRQIPITIVARVQCQIVAGCAPTTVTFRWSDQLSNIAKQPQVYQTDPVMGGPIPFGVAVPVASPTFLCNNYPSSGGDMPCPNTNSLVQLDIDASDGPAGHTGALAAPVFFTFAPDQAPGASLAPAIGPKPARTYFTYSMSDSDDNPDHVESKVVITDSTGANIGSWDSKNGPAGWLGNPDFTTPTKSGAATTGYDYDFSIDCTKNLCNGPLSVNGFSTDPTGLVGNAAPLTIVLGPPPANPPPTITISTRLPKDRYPTGGPVPFSVQVDDVANPAPANVKTVVTVTEHGAVLASWDSQMGNVPLAPLQANPNAQTATGITYDFTLNCPANTNPASCSSALHIDATADETTPSPQSASAPTYILTPQGGPPSAPDAPVLTLPDSIKWDETLLASADQPAPSKNKVIALTHQYTYFLPGWTQPVVHPQTVDANGHSQDSYACTTQTCRASPMMVSVIAFDGSRPPVPSRTADGSVPVIIPLPSPPVVSAVVADDADATRAKSLNDKKSILIDAGERIDIQLAPAAGEAVESYSLDAALNGLPATTSLVLDGNVLTLSCSQLHCHPSDTITINAYAQNAGLKSGPLPMTMGVRVPQSGVNAGTLFCDNDQLKKWGSAMGVGLMALAAVLALAYMLGESLSHPRLIDWAKTEMLQAVMGVVLFLLVVWLVFLECHVSFAPFVPGPLMQGAQNYVDWGVAQTHLSIVMLRYDMGALNLRATHTNYDTVVPGIGGNGFSYSDYAGDWGTSGTLGMLLNLNTTFLLSLLFLKFSLLFFTANSGLFVFLVPLGLILRSAPFMRGVGGALVAIGVGFFIGYPILLALLGSVLPPIYAGHDASELAAGTMGTPKCSYGDMQCLSDLTQNWQNDEQSLTGKDMTSYRWSGPPSPRIFILTAGNPDVNNDVNNGWPMRQPDLAAYYRLTALDFLRALLLPSAGLIILITFVRDLSAIFGEEVDAGKLVQLI